jgi:hypothetical protein
LVETTAVVVGEIFGLVQLRQLRNQREVQAGLELLGPLQTSESAEALLLLHSLPDDLTGEELRQRLGDQFKPVFATLALLESLGPIVARGHVPIEMFAEFYRGPTLLCWRKVRRYVEEQRQLGWPSLFEWLQWLAERMQERVPASGDLPAYQQFKSWKGSSDFSKLTKVSGE